MSSNRGSTGVVHDIIVPHDNRTQVAGASGSKAAWQRITADELAMVIQRHRGDVQRLLLEVAVRDTCEAGGRPLVLGGDHSLTWPALKALTDCLGGVTVVHFDAHHDSYAAVELSHWTVFHHVKQRLPVTVVPVGYHRHHPERRPILPAEPIDGPVYLSIDVDYFSPRLVPSVTYQVPGHPDEPTDLDSLRRVLALCSGPVLGADIVEWHGSADGSAESTFVATLYRIVRDMMRLPAP